MPKSITMFKRDLDPAHIVVAIDEAKYFFFQILRGIVKAVEFHVRIASFRFEG